MTILQPALRQIQRFRTSQLNYILSADKLQRWQWTLTNWLFFHKLCKQSQFRLIKAYDPMDLMTLTILCTYLHISCNCRSDLQNIQDDFCPIPHLKNSLSLVIFLWWLVWIALSRSCKSISVKLRSRLRLFHSSVFFFFSILVLILSCAFGLLFCCITQCVLSFSLFLFLFSYFFTL